MPSVRSPWCTAGSRPRGAHEFGLPTFPLPAGSSHVSDGTAGLALIHDGLLEYEVVDQGLPCPHAPARGSATCREPNHSCARIRPDPPIRSKGPQSAGAAACGVRGVAASRRSGVGCRSLRPAAHAAAGAVRARERGVALPTRPAPSRGAALVSRWLGGVGGTTCARRSRRPGVPEVPPARGRSQSNTKACPRCGFRRRPPRSTRLTRSRVKWSYVPSKIVTLRLTEHT